MAKPLRKYVYDWPRPMLTVDAAVFTVGRRAVKVLLVRRGKGPFRGFWALPGGFVRMDEELQDAAARELAEETGISNITLRQLRAFGRCGRDPRGRNISVVFMGLAEKALAVKAADDAAGAAWFDVTTLPRQMAFDHNEIVAVALSCLKKTSCYKQKRRLCK